MNLRQAITDTMSFGLAALEAGRERVLSRTKDLHWAAYVGADAMLRASQERERVIQQHREMACAELRAAEERLRALHGELNTERRKLELFYEHCDKPSLAAWDEACVAEGVAPVVLSVGDAVPRRYSYDQPRGCFAVDIVLVSENRVLLIQRGNAPFEGQWALPGGYVNIDETSHDAAHRELKEETGIDRYPVGGLRQVGIYDRPKRDPRGRVVSVAYGASYPNDRPLPRAGDDAFDAKWTPIAEAKDLAFDHDRILADALKVL